MGNKIFKLLRYIVVALTIVGFVSINPSLVYPNPYEQPNAMGFVVNFSILFQRLSGVWGEYGFAKELLASFVFAIVAWCRKKELFNCRYFPPYIYILSVCLSVLYMFGESFLATNSAAYVCGDLFMGVLFIFRGTGLFFVLETMLKFFYKNLGENVLYSNKKTGWTWIKMAVCLILLWIPQLVAIYPGGYANDIQSELMQFFGYENWSDPHPPFFTFIVGCCVWLGNVFNNPTFGLYLFILISYLFIALGVSYCLSYVTRKVNSDCFGFIAVLFAGTTCAFSYYASVVGKDAPYSTCLFIMAVTMWQIIDGVEQGNIENDIVRLCIRFSVFSLLASLVRHNGIYIAIPMSIMFTVFVAIKTKKIVIKLALVSMIGIMLFFAITKVLYPALGVEKSMDHLIYTNQLQHTARIYINNPEEFTGADIDILSKVIDVGKISEYYNPCTSDGIKPITNLNAPDEDVKAYRKLWLREIKAHPLVILEASFNVTYGFWTPVAENTENDFSMNYYESEHPEFNFHVPYKIIGIRHIYESILSLWCKMPVIRLLQNPGIYYWIFLFCACYVSHKKKYKYLLCFIPGIITSITYLGFPAYYHHPRYSFPLVYACLMYVGICLYISKKEKEC